MKKNILTVLLMASISLFLFGCPTSSKDATVNGKSSVMSGTAVTGAPVTNGVIRAYDLQGNEVSKAFTNDNGGYSLSNISNKNAYLLVLQTEQEKTSLGRSSIGTFYEVSYFSILPKGHSGTTININPFTSAVTLLYLTAKAKKQGANSVNLPDLHLKGEIKAEGATKALITSGEMTSTAGRAGLVESYKQLTQLMPGLAYVLASKGVSTEPEAALDAIFYQKINPGSSTGVDGALDIVTIEPPGAGETTMQVVVKNPSSPIATAFKTAQAVVNGQIGDSAAGAATVTDTDTNINQNGFSLDLGDATKLQARAEKAKDLGLDQIDKAAPTATEVKVPTGTNPEVAKAVQKIHTDLQTGVKNTLTPIVFVYSESVSPSGTGVESTDYSGFIVVANPTKKDIDFNLYLKSKANIVSVIRSEQSQETLMNYKADTASKLSLQSLTTVKMRPAKATKDSLVRYNYTPGVGTQPGTSVFSKSWTDDSDWAIAEDTMNVLTFPGHQSVDLIDSSYCNLNGTTCIIKKVSGRSDITAYINNVIEHSQSATAKTVLSALLDQDSFVDTVTGTKTAELQQQVDTQKAVGAVTGDTAVQEPVVDTHKLSATEEKDRTDAANAAAVKANLARQAALDAAAKIAGARTDAARVAAAKAAADAAEKAAAAQPAHLATRAPICHPSVDPSKTYSLSQMYDLNALRVICETPGGVMDASRLTQALSLRPSVIKTTVDWNALKGQVSSADKKAKVDLTASSSFSFTNNFDHIWADQPQSKHGYRAVIKINPNGAFGASQGWQVLLKMPNTVVPGGNTSVSKTMAAYDEPNNILVLYGPRKGNWQNVEVGAYDTNNMLGAGGLGMSTIFWTSATDTAAQKFECLVRIDTKVYGCDISNKVSVSPAISAATDKLWGYIKFQAKAERLLAASEISRTRIPYTALTEESSGATIAPKDQTVGTTAGSSIATSVGTQQPAQQPVVNTQAPVQQPVAGTGNQAPVQQPVASTAAAASLDGMTFKPVVAGVTDLGSASIIGYRPAINTKQKLKDQGLIYDHNFVQYIEAHLLGGTFTGVSNPDMFPSYITHILVAFGDPNSRNIDTNQLNDALGDWFDGAASWNHASEGPSYLAGYIDQVRSKFGGSPTNHHQNILLSVGGWCYSDTSGCENTGHPSGNRFHEWSAEAGKHITKDGTPIKWHYVQALINYKYDGLDLDYEVHDAVSDRSLKALLSAMITGREIVDAATAIDGRPRIYTIAPRAVQSMCTPLSKGTPGIDGTTNYCDKKGASTFGTNDDSGALRILFNKELTIEAANSAAESGTHGAGVGVGQKVHVRDLFDMISLMTYDDGPTLDPLDVYDDFKTMYDGPLNIGMEAPNEVFTESYPVVIAIHNSDVDSLPANARKNSQITGNFYHQHYASPHPYTIEAFAQHINKTSNHDGFMLWQYGTYQSKAYPDAYPPSKWLTWKSLNTGICRVAQENQIHLGYTGRTGCPTPSYITRMDSPEWMKSPHWMEWSTKYKNSENY